MSVSISEVLENDGEIKWRTDVEDAEWLLEQRDNFDEMCEEAEALVELHDEYLDFVSVQEEIGVTKIPTWEEYRKESENVC